MLKQQIDGSSHIDITTSGTWWDTDDGSGQGGPCQVCSEVATADLHAHRQSLERWESAPHVAQVARRTEGPAHSQLPRVGGELATAESPRWRSPTNAGRECTNTAERCKVIVICTTCRYWVYKNVSFNLDLIQNLQMMYGHDWNKLANGSCVQRRSLRKL